MINLPSSTRRYISHQKSGQKQKPNDNLTEETLVNYPARPRSARAALWPLSVRARFKRGERDSHGGKKPDKKRGELCEEND